MTTRYETFDTKYEAEQFAKYWEFEKFDIVLSEKWECWLCVFRENEKYTTE